MVFFVLFRLSSIVVVRGSNKFFYRETIRKFERSSSMRSSVCVVKNAATIGIIIIDSYPYPYKNTPAIWYIDSTFVIHSQYYDIFLHPLLCRSHSLFYSNFFAVHNSCFCERNWFYQSEKNGKEKESNRCDFITTSWIGFLWKLLISFLLYPSHSPCRSAILIKIMKIRPVNWSSIRVTSSCLDKHLLD